MVSPINLCPPENKDLPCPVPAGAALPWEPTPPELGLPAPRTDGAAVQSGSNFLYIGGSDGTAAQPDVYRRADRGARHLRALGRGGVPARAALEGVGDLLLGHDLRPRWPRRERAGHVHRLVDDARRLHR